VPVTTADEVLARALAKPMVPIEWSEKDELAELARLKDGGADEVRAH